MSHITFLRLLVMVTILFAFSACQKVIQIDLNNAAPHLVIEANVNDQPGPYVVKLSNTVNFDQNNTFPPVSGAIVILSDNSGQKDTLKEVEAGIYHTTTLSGISGQTYNLSVTTEAQTYQASGTMGISVPIDSLIIQDGPGGFGSPQKRKQVSVLFKDPVGIVNYYRLVLKVNDSLFNSIRVTTDQFRDGESFTLTLRTGDYLLVPGDSIRVYLQNIDKSMYDYFRGLDSEGGGIQQSGSPANPPTNLSGGALGYFNVFGVRSKSIIVP